MSNEINRFYGKIWKAGNSIVITIPDNIVSGIGLKIGDDIVIQLKKRGDMKWSIPIKR